MTLKGKLELTWVNKDERPRLEPRILVEEKELSYGDLSAGNMLIHGDNLLALKALEQDYAREIKCIYIDPPYNTGSAFPQYDDGLEHSIWLTMMRDRLDALKSLLRDDGSIWISIDDNEAHYLKVLCDEIFGRGNFVANVVWQKRTSPDARATLGAAHDHILVYAKNLDRFKEVINRLSLTPNQIAQFKNPDNDPRGPWVSTDYTAQGYRPNQMYTITTPAGASYSPPEGRCWSNIEPVFLELQAQGRMWFGKDGKARPRIKTYLAESEGISAWTWWTHDEVGSNQESKQEIQKLFGKADAFSTPKPERLLYRIIHLATQPRDIVLDSFAGSGTTGAVALKMNRRFIMIESGKHCFTNIIPRLRKVIDGEDEGGVSQALNWIGGSGFKFHKLAETLLIKDPDIGTLDTNPRYTREMLYEAICKIENFRYAPRGLWHGHSSEKRFIYIALEMLTQQALDHIEQELRPDESLLIYYKKRASNSNPSERLEFKRIPRDLLAKCDFEAGV